MSKIKPFKRTLIRVHKNHPETILTQEQRQDLCVDELIYYLNSLNKYLCDCYYNEYKDGGGVSVDQVTYLLEVQHELSQRFLKSSI